MASTLLMMIMGSILATSECYLYTVACMHLVLPQHLCETPYSSCTFPPHPPQVVLCCNVHDLPVHCNCGPAQRADCTDELYLQ